MEYWCVWDNVNVAMAVIAMPSSSDLIVWIFCSPFFFYTTITSTQSCGFSLPFSWADGPIFIKPSLDDPWKKIMRMIPKSIRSSFDCLVWACWLYFRKSCTCWSICPKSRDLRLGHRRVVFPFGMSTVRMLSLIHIWRCRRRLRCRSRWSPYH